MRKVLFTGFCVMLLGLGWWGYWECQAWLKDSLATRDDLEYENRAEVVSQPIFHPVKFILANGKTAYATRDSLKH